MVAAFVHDHRFPFSNGKYYESSGFDNNFINRYLDIFSSLKILAREEAVNRTLDYKELENDKLRFFTIRSSKSLLNSVVRKQIENELIECKHVVIRMPSVLGIFAESICRKKGIPYLVEVVGCPWDSLSFKGIVWKIYGGIYYWLMKRVIKRSKYTVYVSEKFLEDRYPTNGKFTNISNIVLNNYGSCNLVERYNRIITYNPKNQIVIGTCGSVAAEYKSQEDVIHIIPDLIKRGFNVKYQLVGGGSQERLLSYVKKYNVIDQVEFLGELDHKDVFNWLDTLDIYVHPSKQEGLCRAIIEAMSRGLPIIAADAGGIHEQINGEYIFPKGAYSRLLSLLLSFNSEIMLSESKNNYNNAAKYINTVLDKRRRDFFYQFINNK